MKQIIVVIALLFIAGYSYGQTPEEKGLAIAVEADKRDQGWTDQATTLKMILRNRHGDESIREIHGKALEVKNDGDKSLIVFDTPRVFRLTINLARLWVVSLPMKIFLLRKLKSTNINLSRMTSWMVVMYLLVNNTHNISIRVIPSRLSGWIRRCTSH